MNEVYAEEYTGDKVNDAVFKRNATLEEKYNCKIREERNTSPATVVREELIAGVYQYDYIFTGVRSLRSLSASNLLVDFYTIDNMDLSKAWYDHNAIEGLSIAGKSYYITGDACTLDDRSAWIMFFNKDIIDMSGILTTSELYQKVYDGKWTVDLMYEIVSNTAEDKDGDGVYTVGVDRFGWIAENNTNWYMVAAAGLHISNMSSGGDISIPPTLNADVLNAWAKLKPLLTTPLRDVSDGGDRFRKGQATFFAILLGAIVNMGNSDLNYGILPMPKLNEEQADYWTTIQPGWTYGYAVPTNTDFAEDYETNGFTSGREQACYFLEAFSYYSMNTLTVAYYEQVVKSQAVKDAESQDMLEIGLKNKLYDVVAIFNFGSIGYSIFNEAGSVGNRNGVTGSDVNYDTLVSLYESRVTAARKALQNYINYITVED